MEQFDLFRWDNIGNIKPIELPSRDHNIDSDAITTQTYHSKLHVKNLPAKRH